MPHIPITAYSKLAPLLACMADAIMSVCLMNMQIVGCFALLRIQLEIKKYPSAVSYPAIIHHSLEKRFHKTLRVDGVVSLIVSGKFVL